MSKHNRLQIDQQERQRQVAEPAEALPPVGHIVEQHRRCPTCFGTQRGAGNAYGTYGLKRYYKCPKCGMTWTAEFDADGIAKDIIGN